MRGLPLLLAVALGTAPPSPAKRDVALAAKGLDQAVAAGTLTPELAAEYHASLDNALPLLKRLPPLRADELRGVLHDVAAQSQPYTKPAALVLFSTLAENESYLADHRIPADGTDVVGGDDLVYRYFPGHGLVFHPLANFARLNTLFGAKRIDEAAALAAVLIERGTPSNGALLFEYEFPFSAGVPPWTSGMAQAVAAQALARIGELDAATAAARAVPRLTLTTSAGPWVRLYSWSKYVILNAQLQTAVSLADYATIAGDPVLGEYAQRLQDAAAQLLPRFDTGYWSLYSLQGDESSLGYQNYVIALLRRIAARTGEQSWRDFADRFALYETQPPILKAGEASPVIYPEPQDGFKDVAPLRFWLSKRASVTIRVGKSVLTGFFRGGTQTLDWAPGPVAASVYHPLLTAVDENGHSVSLALEPVVVRNDAHAPNLEVDVASPTIVRWRSDDEGTPWLQLAVRLARGSERHTIDLGHRGLAGAARLKLPPGSWHAVLVAVNSAGRKRSVPLGVLPL